MYGFWVDHTGVHLNDSSDTILGQQTTYCYDEFNRLNSRTINVGTTQNFTYVYDRWGNRWQQNVTSTGLMIPMLLARYRI